VRYLIITAAFACVIFPAVVQGVWTGRWRQSDDLGVYGRKLQNVSLDFQDWEGRDLEVNPRMIDKSELSGYISRVYKHRFSGREISIFLACGRPGPVSVHTPDVCYPGAGFEMLSDQKTGEYKDALNSNKSAEFATALFGKNTPQGKHYLRIYWSWNGDGAWRVPAVPRYTFGGSKVLYKMYVVSSFGKSEEETNVEATTRRFIEAFLPEVHRAIFGLKVSLSPEKNSGLALR
jgi:hypothetical protein